MASWIKRNVLGWKIFVRPTYDDEAPLEELTCDKLVLATGTTSIPMPHSLDLSAFHGNSIHSVEMGRRHEELTANSVKHVTVVGAHKSALEVVGICAQAGKKVEWLMRADGGGPTWLWPSKGSNGSSWARMTTFRAIDFTSPGPYHYDRWLNRLLHSGRWWLGKWLAALFWRYLTNKARGDKYSKSESGQKLKPVAERVFFSTI